MIVCDFLLGLEVKTYSIIVTLFYVVRSVSCGTRRHLSYS